MPTSLQYRLQQFESVPPAESWQLILLRLDNESDSREITISKKLTDFTEAPPPGLWSAIEAGLSQPETSTDFPDLKVQFGWPSAEPASRELAPREPANRAPATTEPAARNPMASERSPAGARLFSFNWPRVAMAAAIAGIAISALYYFVSGDKTVQQLTSTDSEKSKPGNSQLPAVVPGNTEPVVSAPATNMAITGAARLFRKSPKTTFTVQEALYEPEMSNTDINYATINATDRVLRDENIAIPTQPIRDNHGNIIMDEKLISAPDVNYVTVTGPNGEQTKISKKFLHALSYMNAGADDDHMGIALQESSLWKWLFKEWRQKLLKQPSFIPSSTNFLDIIELKEILHENL